MGKWENEGGLWGLTWGINLSQPLEETTAIAQTRARQIVATARHATIAISSLLRLIKATAKLEAMNANTRPPQAKKKPEKALVCNRLGRAKCGGSNHRKEDVRHHIAANAASELPPKEWI